MWFSGAQRRVGSRGPPVCAGLSVGGSRGGWMGFRVMLSRRARCTSHPVRTPRSVSWVSGTGDQSRIHPQPSLPRHGRLSPAPLGKLAPLNSLVQKYPRPRAGAAAKMGSGAGATSLQKSVALPRRWGGWEPRSAEPPSLSKIEAEQMVGAGCWWRRQPRLFPRQLVAALLLRAPSVIPRRFIAGGEASIWLLGQRWVHRCFLGFGAVPLVFWYG